MKQEPFCEDCGKTYIKKGETGKEIYYSNIEGTDYGVRTEGIYQCPYCKDIKIV